MSIAEVWDRLEWATDRAGVSVLLLLAAQSHVEPSELEALASSSGAALFSDRPADVEVDARPAAFADAAGRVGAAGYRLASCLFDQLGSGERIDGDDLLDLVDACDWSDAVPPELITAGDVLLLNELRALPHPSGEDQAVLMESFTQGVAIAVIAQHLQTLE